MTKNELKQAIELENYDEVINYANQEKLLMLAAWNDRNIPVVKQRISTLQSFIQHVKKFLGFKETKRDLMLYEIGYLAGIAGGLSHILHYQNKMEEAAKIYNDRLSDVKYASTIVSWLGLSGCISQIDLEKKLNSMDSDVSKALYKLFEEDLVSVTVSGNYKVYSLTDRGLWYFKYLKDGEQE